MFLATLVAATGSSRLAPDFRWRLPGRCTTPCAAGDRPTRVTTTVRLPVPARARGGSRSVSPSFLDGRVAVLRVCCLASLAAARQRSRVVGVRDFRCYAAVVIWAPAWNSFEIANVTARSPCSSARRLAVSRRDVGTAPAALGAAPCRVKLFLWPLARVGWPRRSGCVSPALLSAIGVGAHSRGVGGYRLHRLHVLPRQASRTCRSRTAISFVGMAAALGLGHDSGTGGDGRLSVERSSATVVHLGRTRRTSGGRSRCAIVRRARLCARCSGCTTSYCSSCRSRSLVRASRPSGCCR